jgi:hypothetical protein
MLITMRVQAGELVPLGHGLWVRSDEVVAIEPIREKRGPGRRARVWVRGLPEPLVASRTEESLLRDLTGSRELAERARRLEGAVTLVADSIERIPPVLLRLVAQETGKDLREVIAEARQVMANGDRAAPRSRRRTPPNQAKLPQT